MTRRMLTIKWVFYSLWTLLFLLVQQLVLPHIRVWGVHPFLLPVLSAVAASFEGKREGPVYGLVLGLVCDLLFTGAFPCFYAVTLLLSAVMAGLAARHLIMPGLVCSLAVSAAALVLTDLFSTTALTYSCGAPLTAALWLILRELVVSLPVVLLIHLAFSRVHRRFIGR